jgi:hypothetical protein
MSKKESAEGVKLMECYFDCGNTIAEISCGYCSRPVCEDCHNGYGCE